MIIKEETEDGYKWTAVHPRYLVFENCDVQSEEVVWVRLASPSGASLQQ